MKIPFKLLSIGWAGAVAVMSLLPGDKIPSSGLSDKLEHGFGYLVLCLLIALGWRRPATAFAIAVLFGIAIEFAQGQTGYRTADPMDALANSAGALLGSLLFIYWKRRNSPQGGG